MTWRAHTDRILKRCRDTFGEPFTYIPATGAEFQFKGVFDNAATAVDPETQVLVSINQPFLGVRLADLPSKPKRGDVVKNNSTGIRYRIIDSDEDSWGHSKLMLQKDG